MNVMDAIKTRKSVRAYLAKQVEDEKLNSVPDCSPLPKPIARSGDS